MGEKKRKEKNLPDKGQNMPKHQKLYKSMDPCGCTALHIRQNKIRDGDYSRSHLQNI